MTHSVVYNNGTLTDVTENTVTNVGSSGFAVFPAGEHGRASSLLLPGHEPPTQA